MQEVLGYCQKLLLNKLIENYRYICIFPIIMIWPRGLMVKALVFGTKDLCVRIAPWSDWNQYSGR